MRTWARATQEQRCGRCAEPISVGDPVMLLSLNGLKQPKVRCKNCAESPVPPDLPPLVECTFEPADLKPLRLVAKNMLPLDWKSLGSGEREVGEEG